jgi:hypothetical protein
MDMKKSILCILVAALAMIVGATPVTSSQAKQAARAWAQKNAAFAGKDVAVTGSAVAVANEDGVTLWYRVALNNGSCLVVSPVTELEPVVACLENVSAEGLPSGHPMRAMLERDMADRLRKLGLYVPASTGPALMGAAPAASQATPEDPAFAAWAEQGRGKWARLVGGGAQLMAAKEEGVTEIAIQMGIVDGFEKGGRFTHWNQGTGGGGYCYNYHTPYHAVCGCVATSMGAMMQFFAVTGCVVGATCPDGLVRETQDGIKGATYLDSTGNRTGGYVTLGGPYDWSILDDKTDRAGYNDLSDAQRELLGRVAYDCGVAVAMEWTSGESGAYVMDVASALRNVFGFKDARAVFNPTEDQYVKLIYHQCRAGAPVQLGINKSVGPGGHSVLAVGYGEDEDGVPRTRIFTGWGGSGDGWYALPYITTASVPGGGSHNFDVIQQLVTMIGYDTDETVPVVGHMDAPGEAIDVPGVSRTIYSNESGYFGTRVAPGTSDRRLLCRGKEAQFEIGSAAAMEEDEFWVADVDGLCAALPEEIEFILLNSSVAYTFAKAKEMALAEGKAILRISGVTGTEPTTNLLAYIYALDEQNAGDFTNKFVYLFSSAKSSNPDIPDGNPSIGVFLPSDAEQSGRWQYVNGRLSYGYGYSTELQQTVTNDYDVAEGEAHYTITNEAYVASWRNADKNVSTNLPYTIEGLLEMAELVIDGGWDEFCRRTDGIVLTVASSAGEIGTSDPAYGVHENLYADGDTASVFAPGETVTNETEGVVLGFSGWTLTNETTGAFQKGSGTNATFAVAADDVLTLTWQTVTNAVWIDVQIADYIMGEPMGTTTPGSGWYPYGAASITAKPNDDYKFDQWTFCDRSGRGIALPVSQAQSRCQVLSFMATKPMKLFAHFNDMSDEDAERLAAALATNHTLTVKSSPESISGATMPSCTVVVIHTGSSKTVAMGESTEVPAVDVSVSLSTDAVTDSDGVTWRCTGWTLGGETGVGSVAGVSLDGPATLSWLWEKVVPSEEEPRQPAVVPTAADLVSSPLTIYANADGTLTVEANIGNAVKGWWYVLKTAGDLAGPYAKADGADCVKLAEADGTLKLSFTFTPAEEKRFYKVTVEGDEP